MSTALTITLLGTGSPLPDADRAGPATLLQGGGQNFLVDAGRGVLMRLTAVGVQASNLTAVLITHLHSDHITDLGDLITAVWIGTFQPTPLRVIGPAGTAGVVDHILASLEPDIGYRMAHHDDLAERPRVLVTEVGDGPIPLPGPVRVGCAPTDHRPVEPSIGFRFDHDGAAVVVAGDTVPCGGLDRLCSGAGARPHGDPQGCDRADPHPAADRHARLSLLPGGGGSDRPAGGSEHAGDDPLRACVSLRRRGRLACAGSRPLRWGGRAGR